MQTQPPTNYKKSDFEIRNELLEKSIQNNIYSESESDDDDYDYDQYSYLITDKDFE